MDEPLVAVIVANYNGRTYKYRSAPLLETCLKHLLKTAYGNYKVIVTDDCSKDDSMDYVKSNFKEVYVTKMKRNGKFARNNNNGIRYALRRFSPDYIFLLSNDVIVKDRDWLRKLVNVAESDDKIGLVGPKLVYPNGRIQNAGMPFGQLLHGRGQTDFDREQYSKIEKVQAVVAVAMLIKRQVINRIGLLDENFIGSFEDMDYNLRAAEAGFDVVYDGKVKLVHLHSFTNRAIAKRAGNEDLMYREQLNYSYFILKHYRGLQFVPPFMWLFGRLILESNGHGVVRPGNVRINGPVLKKLRISASAWNDALKMYKDRMN